VSADRALREIDVLIETAKRLVEEKWTLLVLSPHTQGMSAEEHGQALERLRAAGLGRQARRINIESRGPDIIAEREGCLWRIECKGAGGGDGTIRETFKRGLADVVMYFDPPGEWDFRMGLALPDHPVYLSQLTCLPSAARRALRLWVILVTAASVQWFAPDENIEVARKRRRSVFDVLSG